MVFLIKTARVYKRSAILSRRNMAYLQLFRLHDKERDCKRLFHVYFFFQNGGYSRVEIFVSIFLILYTIPKL